MKEEFGSDWFIEFQKYRRAQPDDYLAVMDARGLDPRGPFPMPSNWRQAEGGLWVPKGRLIRWNNLVIDLAKQELLKRWSYISGSSRSIQTFSLGTGYTDPDYSDTDLTTLLSEKDIESWDDALIAPDSNKTSLRKAVCLWLSTEANGVVSEAGLKFDDDSLVTHAMWKKLAIGNITNASEAVVTFGSAHGLSTGDEIHIDSVGGMTEINNAEYVVTVVDSDEVSLDGTNSTGWGTYTSGTGYGWLVVTKSSGEVLETKYGISLTSA